MNQSPPRATRRIVFVAGPGVEILDLVGPLQVFARASEMHTRDNPGSPAIYSVEVVTVSSRRSLIANSGLRITAHRTFREVRGQIDTLLVAGGNAIERNEVDSEAVRWLKRISPRALPWKLPRVTPDPGISPIRTTRGVKRHSVRCTKRSTATLRSFVKGAAFRSCRNSAKFSASKHCSWDSRYPTAVRTRLTKIFLSKILKVESV